jgi:hypothetical protein
VRAPDVGATLAVGALTAALAALPDVRRVAEGVSPGVVWLGLTGGTALVLGPLLVLARAARTSAPVLRASLIGVALASTPVMVLAEVLKVQTHHRPLGAATFGFVALAMVAGAVLVALRLLAWSTGASERSQRLALRFLRVLAATSLTLVVLRAAAAEAYSRDVLDVLRVVVLALLASRALDVPRVVALARRAGVAAWVVLVLVGLFSGRGEVEAKIRERAPVLGGPAAWL